MKYSKALYAFLPLFAFSLLGAGVASAHGMFGYGMFGSNATPDQIVTRQTTMFQDQATLLGISVNDVKSGWAQGKSIVEIAKDHNITSTQLQQKMKDAHTVQLKAQLKTLVDKGIISQAQADQRVASLSKLNLDGRGHMGRGFHGMF